MSKRISILVVGGLLQVALMLYLTSVLKTFTIINFMVFTILLPNVIIAISAFLFGIGNKIKRKIMLTINICYAVMSVTLFMVFSNLFVDEKLISILIENTVVSNNMKVSVSPATAGDNIQSYIIAIAIAGIATMIADKINKKHLEKKEALSDLYDS
mgnify:CR=1 FL=1